MLYAGNIPVCRITVGAAAPALADKAAQELQKYLEKMLHVRLPVSRGEPAAGCCFAELAPEGWRGTRFDRTRVTCKDGILRLTGENEISLLYAVYDFLQHFAGCRFFAPGAAYEYVPERERLVIPEGTLYETGSAFRYRDFVNRTNDPEVLSFAVKNRINTILGCGPWVNGSEFCSQENADLIHAFGLKVRGPGHCWKHLVPKAELFAEHPEYFPVVNGRRTVTGRTACFSNPAVRKIFLDNLRAYLRKTPWWDIFAFWAEDVPDKNYCDCPECRRLSAGGWYVTLMNEAARVVEEELPHTVFEWIVYDSSETPPETRIPFYRNGENMLCDLCLGRFRDLFTPFAEKRNANAPVFARYAAWQQYLRENNYAGKRMLMEYYNLCEYPNTGPCTRAFLWPLGVMQQDIAFYQREGMDGLGAFTGLDRLCFPSPLRMWLWLQLWSGPSQNIAALQDEFYRKFYGEKAAAVQEYMRRFERLMYTPADEKNMEELEALRPEAGDEAMALHLDYAILLKQMFLAYTQNDVVRYRELEARYQHFQSDHAELLRHLAAPFPLLWFDHFTDNIGFLPDGTPKKLRPGYENTLK